MGGLESQLAMQDTSTPDYTFAGCMFLAKIVEIYDGDSCAAVVKINDRFQKIQVRLKGIDAPDLKPKKDTPDRESLITKANESKRMFSTLVYQRVVRMMIHDFDKYGRFLATIYQRGSCMGADLNVNEYMLSGGYAVKSEPKKRRENSDQQLGERQLSPRKGR